MPKQPPIFLIAGPTASGKSSLALELARQAGGVIINGDSRQIYKGLPLLSAMPSAADQKSVAHALYGCFDPARPLTVAAWQKEAVRCIQEARRRHKIPFVVGGTGLYFKSLLTGISALPAVDPAIRDSWRARLEKEGPEALWTYLQSRDPLWAAAIPPTDIQRLCRGLEILTQTGRSLSWWHESHPPVPPFPPDCFRSLVLLPPRDGLYARCRSRLEAVMAEGGLKEIRAVRPAVTSPLNPLAKTLGYGSFCRYLDQECSYEEAFEETLRKTRRFAKRQYTWFRHQTLGDRTTYLFSLAAIRSAAEGDGFATTWGRLL